MSQTQLADVTVTIEGGRVDVTVWNAATVVEIRNYDVEGVDPASLLVDDDGDPYVQSFSSGA